MCSRETLWWCDASVLLPLLAVGSINNQYAEDLFKDLRELNANTLTTTRLLREIMEHLEWASRLFNGNLCGLLRCYLPQQNMAVTSRIYLSMASFG